MTSHHGTMSETSKMVTKKRILKVNMEDYMKNSGVGRNDNCTFPFADPLLVGFKAATSDDSDSDSVIWGLRDDFTANEDVVLLHDVRHKPQITGCHWKLTLGAMHILFPMTKCHLGVDLDLRGLLDLFLEGSQ